MSSGATFSPIEALEGQNIVDMAIGLHFALFVTADGKLFGCGHNAFGQLMLGRADQQLVGITEGPFATIKISTVSCGAHHTFAIANAPPLPHFGARHFSVP
jgi:alpha-tubulin suppressor-like RCC1 family protein